MQIRLERRCDNCGAFYSPKANVVTGKKRQRFCSKECRLTYWKRVLKALRTAALSAYEQSETPDRVSQESLAAQGGKP